MDETVHDAYRINCKWTLVNYLIYYVLLLFFALHLFDVTGGSKNAIQRIIEGCKTMACFLKLVEEAIMSGLSS
ncbi:hypothetical protein T4D_8785 [Trichinella pseudospiralis]|uniref:Uncharacterized protein n=1 Tax=Trichinella pseudospiralis TaxID=6337 RepID=A0A0V1G3G2_TRIPS|nr:hypothetical protein T4D_8785 [Trichinella pseudospiralis]